MTDEPTPQLRVQSKYLALMKRMLRPGGQVVHVVLAAEHTFLPHQYFLVFAPAGAQGPPAAPAGP